MTSLESIEKLRDRVNPMMPLNAEIIASEIEREIAEKYMELPVDADGVLIRIGDTVSEVSDCVPMKVMSLTFYEDCVDVNACGMNPKLLVHVKPRTVEDVLVEFYGEFAKAKYGEDSEVLSHYADEIRELLGGDGR